ncbi:MAG: DUF4268 domain-containing protein [Candidatus Heimdallarchaeota archaeon]|nr:DUF4268 domain-containing protein [Candidatus Heimdallarchaeota archaeon]
MAFQTAITIKEVIDKIEDGKYVLPAIQREFVWKKEQIRSLFDSLMRNYPIGSFLFWEIKRENVNEYQYYGFIKNYHEKNFTHNPKLELDDKNDIIAILDGQQRFTSLYLGLTGSYSKKIPRKAINNPNSYPRKTLHLNIVNYAQDNDLQMLYDFRFLIEEEYKDLKDGWFKVADILKFQTEGELMRFLAKYNLGNNDISIEIFFRLFSMIHKDQPINYFLEKENSIEKVLDIFIRVNSGGTQLSYSDLLLSIATAQWTDLDAREVINQFVDDINNEFHLKINKDLVLKYSLVVTPSVPNVQFKVSNFKKEIMEEIEKNWFEISVSLRYAAKFISSIGYTKDSLTSNNSIIPVAYFFYKMDNPDKFLSAKKYKTNRILLRKWFVISLLKRLFSGNSDNTITRIRNVFRKSAAYEFPINELAEEMRKDGKSIVFQSKDIEDLIYTNYGSGRITYSILSLLYPGFNNTIKFHIDHIHPKSYFTDKNLRRFEISDTEFYKEHVNYIPNLQFLVDNINIQKTDRPFQEWFEREYEDDRERIQQKSIHYIPDCDLDFRNFKEFFESRKKLLMNELQNQLDLGLQINEEIETIEDDIDKELVRSQFWDKFLEFDSTRRGIFSAISPHNRERTYTSIGIPYTKIGINIFEDSIYLEFSFDHPERENNISRLSKIIENKENIKEKLGFFRDGWINEQDQKKQGLWYKVYEHSIFVNTNEWDNIFDLIFSNIEKLIDIIPKYLE